MGWVAAPLVPPIANLPGLPSSAPEWHLALTKKPSSSTPCRCIGTTSRVPRTRSTTSPHTPRPYHAIQKKPLYVDHNQTCIFFACQFLLFAYQFRPLIEIRDTSPVTFDLNYESFYRSQIVTECWAVLSYVKMSPGFGSFDIVSGPTRADKTVLAIRRCRQAECKSRWVGYRHTWSTAITRCDEKFFSSKFPSWK